MGRIEYGKNIGYGKNRGFPQKGFDLPPSLARMDRKVRKIKESTFHIIPSKELFTYLRLKWKQEPQRRTQIYPKICVRTKGLLETLQLV